MLFCRNPSQFSNSLEEPCMILVHNYLLLSKSVNNSFEIPLQYKVLLYSWRFSRYSAPIHWLVHGHMTSNNETVSRQMP